MSAPVGEIYFAVLLHAKTTARVNAIEHLVTAYDFSLDDSNCLYHVIDAEILQKCLLYASTGLNTEFKIDQQHTDELANAINLINRIGSLELDVNDPEHNSLQRYNNPDNPSDLSYPGVSPTTTPIITPDRSTLALNFVSYLASLAFYNPQAHGPFSNILTISNDFIQGIQTDSNNYTTLGAQLVEQLDPGCNDGDVLRTIFDQLIAIDPDRFNVSDNLENGFQPFPFKNGDCLKFDVVINSVLSTPSEPTPLNAHNLNAVFRNLSAANLFKNNKNLILTPALNGAPAIVNHLYVDSLSNNDLIMKPKIFRVKLLLQSRQSLVNLPSVAATYYLYNATMPSIAGTFSDYTFTGIGLNLNDTQGHFREMVNIITCPETLIGTSLITQMQDASEMFVGLTLNVGNIPHLSQLFHLIKLSNTLLVDMLSNLENLSNEDLNPFGTTTDPDLINYALLVENITYIQEVLLLLLSLSNSGNSPEVFKQKELMLVKLASNIISNVSDVILQYFTLYQVYPNGSTTLNSFVISQANAVDILPVGGALVLYLDCLKQLSDYNKTIQVISTIPNSTRFIGDNSIGFCEPVQLEFLIKKFVSDMNPESPPASSSYTEHLKQYCKLVKDVLLVSNFILEGGSFNPSIFINSMIDKTNSAYSSILLNYGLVVTDIQTKNATLTSMVVSGTGEFKNLTYAGLFDPSGQPPTGEAIADSISSAFDSSVTASGLIAASYTDFSSVKLNEVIVL
jgi:hypothetical protein